MNPASIDTVAADALGRDEFDARFVRAERPVLIRGGMRPAPACRLWTAGYLTRTAGHREIVVTESETSVFNPNAGSHMGPTVEQPRLFADAIRLVASPATPAMVYVMQQSIPEKLPELAADVPPPMWIPDRGRLAKVNLWLGARGCSSPLHFDLRHNFHGMVWGSKRFTLFAPSEAPNLYPALQSRHRHVSEVNALAPDLDRFPKFRQASSMVTIAGPGDMIFLPSRWWHLVESLETSLAVNYWWDTEKTRNVRRLLTAVRQRSAAAPEQP